MALPTWASVIIAIGTTIVAGFVAERIYHQWTRVPMKPAGKRCFITGGSTGLGKSLAIELVKAGAHVCIVARRVSELENAVKDIEAKRRDETQKVIFVSADVTSKTDIVRAFDEAKENLGGNPELVFACAGMAKPKLFLDHSMEDFEAAANLNYLGQAFTAHQAALRMRDSGIKDGKIVFVTSMLALMGFVGWSTYSSTKYAVRGLADTLRNELLRYGIGVHVFFPGTINTPGLQTESITKPGITWDIEGASTAQSPEDCAKSLMNGLYAGHYMITTEAIAEILRATTRGVNPANNLFLDCILSALGQVFGSGFALFLDRKVVTATNESFATGSQSSSSEKK